MSFKNSQMHSIKNCLQLFDVMINAMLGGPNDTTYYEVSESELELLKPFLGMLGLKQDPKLKHFGSIIYSLEGVSHRPALFLARSYAEVIADRWPLFLRLSMKDQLGLFLSARDWPKMDFVRYAKYITVWPMARFLNNPLPKRPKGFKGHPMCWVGKVKRFLKNRLIVKRVKNARFFWSVLQGVKRGADVISEEFVEETMVQHCAKLSTQVVPRKLSEFSEYYRRIAKGFRVRRPQLYEATTSASFETKRSEGGARQLLRRFYSGTLMIPQLIAMIEVGPGEVSSSMGLYPPTMAELLADCKDTHTSVMVHAVLEPLKCRLITKGSAFRYWYSRFLQKDMWEFLFKREQFSPIGHPLAEDDIYRLLEREQRLGLDSAGFQWVSGDYSGATDGLNIEHTKAAFESFLDATDRDYIQRGRNYLSLEAKDTLRSVLYEQKLNYPERLGIPSAQQKNGQLMGSTLSFPILCVVNLATYWMSLETLLERTVRLKDLPVLINGDDILFRASPALYELWKENSSSVGFELSLGKNYIHPRYLTMNSQLYDWNRSNLTKIEFFNVGLLTGQSKITGRMGAKCAPIWDIYDETMRGATDIDRAHRRFIHYHRESIDLMTQRGNLNLFIPREFGGLGFHNPGVENYTTAFQLRLGTVLRSHYLREKECLTSKLTASSRHGSLRLKDGRARVLIPIIGPLLETDSDDMKRFWFEPPLCSAWDTEVDLVWKTILSNRDILSQARKLQSHCVKKVIKSIPLRVGLRRMIGE